MNGFCKKTTPFLKAAILAYGGLIFVSAPSAAGVLADRAAAAGLAPHKALYEIHLLSSQSGSQLVNVSGRMFYEWRPTCDAWVSNHRFDINYEYADTPPMTISSDFATFEPFDGKSMDFTSQRRKDGILYEELRGRAEIKDHTPEDQIIGEALYTIPRDLSFDLPQGSMFPVGHTLEVLNALKNGTKFFKAVIFDGSDAEGPVEVTSFMGSAVDESGKYKDAEDIDQGLIDTKAWKSRLAFFPMNEPSETADYEMSVIFHENGVISDMTIEYNDFTITQTLVALESVKPECGPDSIKGKKKQSTNR